MLVCFGFQTSYRNSFPICWRTMEQTYCSPNVNYPEAHIEQHYHHPHTLPLSFKRTFISFFLQTLLAVVLVQQISISSPTVFGLDIITPFPSTP
mmetsp:Transcript_25250/g.45515  ORF Transcript_25250/g.45515 Transcript_25250/m.45515 type:complete len:94 (+) Transcript_25250:281-562(+)